MHYLKRFGGSLSAAIALAILAGLSLVSVIYPAGAQETGQAEPLVVGLHVNKPFVTPEASGYSGMAVDIWENAARELKVGYEYVTVPTVRELIERLENGTIDVAVGNISVTRARAERVEFTYPWYDAGLRLMIHAQSASGFDALFDEFRDAGHMRAYAWLLSIIVGATLALTLFDRTFHKDFPTRWREGIAESFYTVMSVLATGRVPSRPNLFGWVGRLIQAIWLVCGIAVLAYVTSTVTSVMTTLSLENQIETLDDLSGEPIGVFAGSFAEDYIDAEGHPTVAYPGIDEAVAGLQAGEVAALAGDGPVLDYYEHTHPDSGVDVVGPMFADDKYAFAVRRGSEFARPLDLAVIGIDESGLLEDLRTRYFGEDD